MTRKKIPKNPKKARTVKGLVLAFGTFDLLHPGHLHYLSNAKKLGKKLVVIVARDANVKFFKKKKPINNEKNRLLIVQSLKAVEKAVLGQKSNFFSIIKKFNPETIALGYDQWPGRKKLVQYLKENNIPAKIKRLPAFNSRIFKSHHIKNRIKKNN